MTDISRKKAIEVIKQANKYIKKEQQWLTNDKSINAIQVEFAEGQNNYGEYDMEISPYITKSGHCEFVFIESDEDFTEGKQ